jgi:hypothetical protein
VIDVIAHVVLGAVLGHGLARLGAGALVTLVLLWLLGEFREYVQMIATIDASFGNQRLFETVAWPVGGLLGWLLFRTENTT